MPQYVGNLSEKPVNCIGCGKKIAEGSMTAGRISIKCPTCKVINVIEAKNKPEGRSGMFDVVDTSSSSIIRRF